jgi:hypothetical protein
MSTTADRLDTAAFPEDYADILVETLGITAANYLSVKDALDHYRRLDDDEATELMQQIAEHEDASPPVETPPSDDAPYFRGASGTRYPFAEIADRIRREAPQTLGKHIFVQLEAIGLLREFQDGTTPYGLPFTFAEAPRMVEKRLTSNGMFSTPGFFRALQNDYRIKGAPRRRAVKLLSEGYGLPRAEAERLLSGAIEIVIDEATGTVTYAVAAQPESSTR